MNSQWLARLVLKLGGFEQLPFNAAPQESSDRKPMVIFSGSAGVLNSNKDNLISFIRIQ